MVLGDPLPGVWREERQETDFLNGNSHIGMSLTHARPDPLVFSRLSRKLTHVFQVGGNCVPWSEYFDWMKSRIFKASTQPLRMTVSHSYFSNIWPLQAPTTPSLPFIPPSTSQLTLTPPNYFQGGTVPCHDIVLSSASDLEAKCLSRPLNWSKCEAPA